MTEASSDLRQKASQYRDHLKAELAKVEQFLAMADHIDKASENIRSAFPANGEGQADEEPLNLFDKTN